MALGNSRSQVAPAPGCLATSLLPPQRRPDGDQVERLEALILKAEECVDGVVEEAANTRHAEAARRRREV